MCDTHYFPFQQLLRERLSVLRYTYSACSLAYRRLPAAVDGSR